MPGPLYRDSRAVDDIYGDLQKIVRSGLYRFRRADLKAIPQAAGYPAIAREGAVRGAIRKLIEEQIGFLPTEDWQEFAERLFGFTHDTQHQSVADRERIAGEGLEKPRHSSTIRGSGGAREVVVTLLAEQIKQWADYHNPGWRHGVPLTPLDFTRFLLQDGQ